MKHTSEITSCIKKVPEVGKADDAKLILKAYIERLETKQDLRDPPYKLVKGIQDVIDNKQRFEVLVIPSHFKLVMKLGCTST